MINVAVERTNNENNTNLIRRFTKRVQGSGILPRVRGIRYKNRNESSYKRKRRTLTSIGRKAEYEKQVKLGKIIPKTQGRHGA